MKIRHLLVLPLAAFAAVLLSPPGTAAATTYEGQGHTSAAVTATVRSGDTAWALSARLCGRGDLHSRLTIRSPQGALRVDHNRIWPGDRVTGSCLGGPVAAPRPATNAGGVRSWIAPLASYRATTCYEWRPALYVNGTLVSKAGVHTGLDLAASLGAPIRAVAAGRVIRVGWRGGFGNAVEIAHGSGITSMYAHQSRILVRYNQWVGVGQTIGRVGSTGASTGNHLHLAMYRNGSPFNPTPYLEARGAPIRGC